MSTTQESIKITRSDAEKLDISKLSKEINQSQSNAANNTLNNYKSMQLDSNDSNKDEDTINIRRSDKLTHDVRELSAKR